MSYTADPRAEELQLLRQLLRGAYAMGHSATMAIAGRCQAKGEVHTYEHDGKLYAGLLRPGQELVALDMIDQAFDDAEYLRDIEKMLEDGMPIDYFNQRRQEIRGRLLEIAGRVEALELHGETDLPPAVRITNLNTGAFIRCTRERLALNAAVFLGMGDAIKIEDDAK